MSGLTGDLSTLKSFTASLRELPRTLAIQVAAEAAPALTEAARATFDAGEDAYGVSWMPSASGQSVTLKKSGALAQGIQYVAIGTKLRVKLPVSYAKYQLGRRPAFPRQGEPLPASYVAALKAATDRVIHAALRSA
jgi:hypothetical protein